MVCPPLWLIELETAIRDPNPPHELSSAKALVQLAQHRSSGVDVTNARGGGRHRNIVAQYLAYHQKSGRIFRRVPAVATTTVLAKPRTAGKLDVFVPQHSVTASTSTPCSAIRLISLPAFATRCNRVVSASRGVATAHPFRHPSATTRATHSHATVALDFCVATGTTCANYTLAAFTSLSDAVLAPNACVAATAPVPAALLVVSQFWLRCVWFRSKFNCQI